MSSSAAARSGSNGRRAGAALLIVVAVWIAAACAGSSSAQTTAGAGVTVTIAPTATTPRLPADFMGLGLEFQTVPEWASAAGAGLDRPLFALLHGLSPDPVFRIGGVSTDRSWWPVRGMRRPLGVSYTLGRRWLHAMRQLAGSTNARLILGVNLEAGSTRVARVEAVHFIRGLGRRRIAALEIGNEPELYEIYAWYKRGAHGQFIPWYSSTPGRPVYSRPKGWGLSAYFSQFSQFAAALPHVPLAGLSSGSQYWLSRLPGFLAANPGVSTITFHRYGMSGCQRNPAAANYTSIPNLLGLHDSRVELDGVAQAASQAHADHASFRIDEMNSAFCDGVPGVSNTFASALWVLDNLFSMRSDGVDSVNVHTYPAAASALFDVGLVDGSWAIAVHPEYYGLLMFQRAAPAGSRLLRVASTSIGSVRDWATIGADRTVRLLLLNDSQTSVQTIHIRAALVSPAHATVTALEAPSAASTTRVTLGGLSYGPTTSTGQLRLVTPAEWAQPPGFPYALEPPAHTASVSPTGSTEVTGATGTTGDSGTPAPPTLTATRTGATITVPAASATLITWRGGLRAAR